MELSDEVKEEEEEEKTLGIMAGMGHKDNITRDRCCARCWHWQWPVPGWFYRLCSSRCVVSSVGYGPQGQLRSARRRYGSGMCMADIAGYDAFALCSL